MGYYTKYNLYLSGPQEATEKALTGLEAEGHTAGVNLFDVWRGDAGSCKWYEHESEMKAVSILYPDVVFQLVGEGEEPGDLWHKYFKNGKMQKCLVQITYPPYDERLLR